MAHSWRYHGYQKIIAGISCRKERKRFPGFISMPQKMEIPSFLCKLLHRLLTWSQEKADRPDLVEFVDRGVALKLP
jgi:hypothetical protein